MEEYIQAKRKLENANVSIVKLSNLISDAIDISRTSANFIKAIKTAITTDNIEKALLFAELLHTQIYQENMLLERMDARTASMRSWIR